MQRWSEDGEQRKEEGRKGKLRKRKTVKLGVKIGKESSGRRLKGEEKVEAREIKQEEKEGGRMEIRGRDDKKIRVDVGGK